MTVQSKGNRPYTRNRFGAAAAASFILSGAFVSPAFSQAAGTGAAGTAGAATGTGVGAATGVGTGVGTAGTGTGVGAGTNGTSPTGTAGGLGAPTATAGQGPATPANGNPTTTPGTNGADMTTNNGAPTTGPTNSTGTSIGSGTNNGGQTSSVPGGSVPTSNDLSPVFDLGRTISAALASSADIQNQQRNVQIDRKRADEVIASERPNIGASASATRFDQATKIAFGGGAPLTVQNSHTETLALTLSQRVDLTGQIRAASSQAQLQSLEDQLILNQIENRRILRAKTIYFNLLRAQHQVAVAAAAQSTALVQQSLAVKLNQQQVGQKIDVLRANTQVAATQQALTQAQNSLDIARVNFNDLVGRPLNAPVTLQDVPGANSGIAIATGPNTVVGDQSIPAADTSITQMDPIDIDQSIATGQTNRPEVQAAAVNVRVAQTGIKLARAGLEPTFAINAGGDYYPTTSFSTPRQRVAEITATFTLPLYDGGATRDRVQEAQLRTQNAQTALDSTKEDVALDIRQAYLNLQTASQQISTSNTALQQAIAARQLAQIRYAGQVGLYLEVTDAQAALVQAETNQLNAVYDYLTARAQFENAIGTPSTR